MTSETLNNKPVAPTTAETQWPSFLNTLCWLSMALGIIIIIAAFLLVLIFIFFGAFEKEAFLVLADPLWKLYLRFLYIALYGLALFSGAKWCREAKPIGWHVMSFCSLFAALVSGKLTSSIVPFNESCSILIVAPLSLLFTAGYVYLFTDQPRTFLEVNPTKRWQMFLLHSALYLLLRAAYVFLTT